MGKSNVHARDWITPVLRSSCNSHGSLDGEIHRKGNGNRKPGAAVRGGARRTYIHSLNLVPGRWLILDLTRQPWRNCYTLFLDHGWKRRGRLSPLCSIPRDETRRNAFHEKAADAGHLAKFEIILRKKRAFRSCYANVLRHGEQRKRTRGKKYIAYIKTPSFCSTIFSRSFNLSRIRLFFIIEIFISVSSSVCRGVRDQEARDRH